MCARIICTSNRYISQIAEAVKMNRTILVVLRNAHIGKTIAANGIFQMVPNLFTNLFRVISIHKLRGKCPCKKILKFITKGNIPYCRSCPCTADLFRSNRVSSLSFRWHIVLTLLRLITDSTENRCIRNL